MKFAQNYRQHPVIVRIILITEQVVQITLNYLYLLIKTL